MDIDDPRRAAGTAASEPSNRQGAARRVALGVSYRGTAYKGWQSQTNGGTIQDALESALSRFADRPTKVMCAGRTDAGVHGINQVVHLDTPLTREPFSWVRGPNALLPSDIAVQWAREVPLGFHARNSAVGRRYTYVLLESAVRPALEAGQVGWTCRPLDLQAMRDAAEHLIGEHDFTSFRSSQCQSPTPVKHLRQILIRSCPSATADARPATHSATVQPVRAGIIVPGGRYWRFDFEGKAFLHHMIRNIMGGLLAVGTGAQPVDWMARVLAARDRKVAAPTFSPDGLYFVGPRYDLAWGLPEEVPALSWLPA